MIDFDRLRRGVDSDGQVGGDRRYSTGIAHPAQDKPAESRVAVANKIAFRGGGIVVIHSARTVRSIPARNQAPEGRYENGSAIQDGTLAHDEAGSGHKRAARCAKHVSADVERIVINTERFIIKKLARAGTADGVLLDKIVGPDGVGADHAGAGRVRDGDQHAVGQGPRHVDDDQNPAAGESVITDLRVRCKIGAGHGRHDRAKKCVCVQVEHAIRSAGAFVEGP